MNWVEYIDTDEAVLAGKPKIKGTRLSVEFLIGRLADGWTEDEILENYPSLTRESILAVYRYVFELMQDGFVFLPVDRKAA